LERVPRKAGGFGAKKPKRRRRKGAPDSQQLKDDHGVRWQRIEKVLNGEKAATPEEMMRARFSALRNKDAAFMGETEIPDDRLGGSTQDRARFWAIAMGLTKPKADDPNQYWEATDSAERVQVLEARDNFVEYRMYCGSVGTVHEKSIFVNDPKLGWIYKEPEWSRMEAPEDQKEEKSGDDQGWNPFR
jgi:uncharacterized protein YchJ